MSLGARDRMIDSAASLFRTRGVVATGFREICEASGVSRGSIAHHFPGGKSELVREVVVRVGEYVRTSLDQSVAAGSPREAVRAFVELWRCTVVDSHATAGCAVAAVATESTEPELVATTADVFRSWREPLTRAVRAAGLPLDRSKRLATTIIAALEGALVLCRAERSERPLRETGQELDWLLSQALPPQSSGRRKS